MKNYTASRNGCLILFFAILVSSVSTRAASSCDVAVRLDALMVSSNITKVGFPPLLDDNQNPTIFFRKKKDFSESRTTSCYICHEDSSRTTSDTWAYDGLTGNSPVLTNWSGFLSYLSQTNGATAIDCTSTRTGPSSWSNPSCGNTPANATDIVVSNRTISSYTLVLHSEQYDLVTTPNGSSVHEDVSDSDLEINLTQPYALSDFLAAATAGLNAAPWPSWTNASRTGWAERGGRNVITYINEDRAEFNAALTKLKYRIAVNGPKDEKQTITWIERFIPNGGGSPVDTSLSEEVTFTGQEQYLLATQQDQGKIVNPPTQTGRIEVLVLSTWSCDSPNCGPGKGKVSTGSIDVRMSLGRTASGKSAGYLFIKEDAPRSDIATPQRLGYFLDPNVQVIKDGAALRQVNAPQTLAQVVPVTWGYEVRFFGPTTNKDVNGYYIPVGQPFYTWRIESPTNNSNYLTVTQLGPGDPFVSSFAWSAPDLAWALVIGNIRKEIRVWTTNGIDRTETFTVREMNDAMTYKQVRTWRQYGGLLGDLLISETTGDGGAALTTTYTYYTNPASPGSYGKVWTISRPNGAGESFTYDSAGRQTQWNAPGNRTVQYFYTPVESLDNGTLETNTPRTIVEKILIYEVARTYRSFRTNETLEIRGAAVAGSWNDAGNLITTNRTSFAGNLKIESSRYPDGTLRIAQTPTNYPGTQTESFGQPNATSDAVVDGTRNSTQFDGAGRITLRETVDIASGIALSRETYEYADPYGPPTRVVYLDGTATSTSYGCCNATAIIDRDGTLTTYTYDSLDRLALTTRNGITWSNAFDAMGNVIRTTRVGTDGSTMIVSEATYDTTGRQVTYTTGLTNTTTTSVSSGGSLMTTIYPDGGTRYDTYNPDGSIAQVAGTAAAPLYYEYESIEGSGTARLSVKEFKGDSSATEWAKTYFDIFNRPFKTELADGSYTEFFYNAKGQLWKQRGFDGRVTLYAYNTRGEVEYTALDVNNNDAIDLAGMDRVVQTVTDVSGGGRRVRVYSLSTTGSSNSVLVATVQTSLNGNQTSETRFGVTTSTLIEYLGGGIQRVTQIASDNSRTISYYQAGQLISVTRTGASGEELGRTTYRIDVHGRPIAAIDARTGLVITNQFNSADQLSAVITPAFTNIPSQSTSLYYDGVGRVVRAILPDGLNLTNQFNGQGQLLKTFGARTYPVNYGYDSQARLTNMPTSSAAGSATTSWQYHSQRGWLSNKRYINGLGPDYTYTSDGRLQSRHTPRATTDYGYTTAGDLTTVSYDGPGLNLAFLDQDRLGRATRITQGTNTTLLAYHDSGLVINETSGGLIVTNSLDGQLRKSSLTLKRTNGTTLLSRSYTYDGASRIQSVTAGSVTVDYTYLAKSPLVQNITFRSGGSLMLATVRAYDPLNRLTEIGSAPTAASPLVFVYRHNLVNQRTNATEADGSYWVYQYDSLGQLTSGKKYFSDNTPIAGQQFEYVFDSIGNRTSTKVGGDAAGSSLRSASYTPNTLNQYTSRGVPSAADVVGQAPVAASVTINGLSTYRKTNYWQLALNLNNASAAVWQGTTNIATLQGNKQTNIGNLFLPLTPEGFTYDDDGNLTQDGRWSLSWDIENRLTSFISRSDTPQSSWLSSRLSYDWRGRRVSKVVSNWNGSAWVKLSETRFVYDGWRLLAELDANNNLLRSYVWGADLSGTLDGAGGVGGLLAMIDHVGGGAYFYAQDGNGNIRALVNAADGTIAAQYDYGPFHELIRATGPLAKINSFLAATKYQDWESGFYYYGFRYYDPNEGRWLNCDPLGEDEGPNIYAFVHNDAADLADRDGRSIILLQPGLAIPKPIFETVVQTQRPIIFDPIPPPLLVPPQPPASPVENPAPEPSPKQSPQPGPRINAPPATVEPECREWLCRLGKEWENRVKLSMDAQAAEKAGFGHGVSVLLFKKPPANASCVPKFILEAVFQVNKTGARQNHYTVILPKPVTDEVEQRFNRTLGRISPPRPPPRIDPGQFSFLSTSVRSTF